MTILQRIVRALATGGLSILFSIPLSGQAPAAKSRHQTKALEIDGQAGDWAFSGFVRDRRSGVEVAFRNDGANLYVLFIARGSDVIESLDSTGLTILVKPAGAKASRGVLFVDRPVPAEAYILWRASQGMFLSEAEETRLREAGQHDLCLPFAVSATGSTYGPLPRTGETDPPVGAVALTADTVTYECRIPLAAPARVPGGIGVAPGGSAEVSFRWGGAARKILSVKPTRATPPAEAGDLSGSGETWAQEYLNSFDSLSHPKVGTRKFVFTVAVTLSDAR